MLFAGRNCGLNIHGKIIEHLLIYRGKLVTKDDHSTSFTLIDDANSGNALAWKTLGDIYSPLVFCWARKAGLQKDDADDIVQEVFRILIKSLAKFRKDQPNTSFRGWLWTVTRNEIRRWVKKQARDEQGIGGSTARNLIANVPDWISDDTAEIEPDADAETLMIQRAAEVIKGDFEIHTWQAFWRTTVDGHSTTEVASDLKMTTGGVRQAKFRVMTRLKEFLS